MYTVLFSKDEYLLARMATDLEMEGFEAFLNFGSPFLDDEAIGNKRQYLHVYPDNVFALFFQSNNTVEKLITLTENNYIDTLGFLIENKNK